MSLYHQIIINFKSHQSHLHYSYKSPPPALPMRTSDAGVYWMGPVGSGGDNKMGLFSMSTN